MTRLFFCAGESSGDLHGANLIRALRASEPNIACAGIGGPLMADAGMDLRYNLAEKAIMGFTEVVKSFRFIRRLFLETVDHLAQTRPDALILIDYPGFNIRLAQRAHALGIPVVYYISPQVWAWKKKRIQILARVVAKMLVILPFEEALYSSAGVPCTYVGHPLLDQVAAFAPKGHYPGQMLAGILPGSRAQEIQRLLPAMLAVARGLRERFPGVRFVAPCVDEGRAAQIRALAGDFPLEVAVGGAYEVLSGARFCLVASGTATLEAALFGVPMVIMYRISTVSYWLAKRLVRIEHIGLVNILAQRRIVPEFVQGEAEAGRILPVACELMEEGPRRARMLTDLESVKQRLGTPGASQRAAREILAVLQGVRHD